MLKLVMLLFSVVALITTYSIAQISSFKFKIHDDIYYSLFHFFGGVFTGMFFYSIFGQKELAILLTFIIALLWEVHEWILWKYWLKEKIYKPKKRDTIADIILGTVGATLFIILL